MTATITATNGGGTTTPLEVLMPYSPELQSRNVIHDLIGGDIAVSLVPPRPRSGQLLLLYPDEASAKAAVQLHSLATSFTLVESERPLLDMIYVVDGRIILELQGDTRKEWIVTVGFQEVTP